MNAQPSHDSRVLHLVPPHGELGEHGHGGLTVTHRDRGPIWVMGLAGEADLATRDQLDRGLSHALARSPAVVVVDVSELDFCDSRCATTVIEANCQTPGTEMVLTGSRGIVRRVFDLLDPAQTLPRHE